VTDLDRNDPNYWVKAFEGTSFSVVVPPYIRFLQGSVVLYKAMAFLEMAKEVANNGNVGLARLLTSLEDSKESKQLGISYEKFFASHLTITLVSEVEHFLGSAIAAALRLHPEKMGSQTIKLTEVISAASKDEIIDRAAGSVMNNLMYEKPLDYMRSLANILSIDAATIEQSWPAFVELKARRDVGVHNNWVSNEIYLRKVREAGIPSPYAIGVRLIPDFRYLQRSMDFCKDLVEVIVQQLAGKWIPAPGEVEPGRVGKAKRAHADSAAGDGANNVGTA
jgi:hypothetical protein